jgi:hypothetical protein
MGRGVIEEVMPHKGHAKSQEDLASAYTSRLGTLQDRPSPWSRAQSH